MYRPIKVQQIKPEPIKSLAIGSFRGIDSREGNFRTDTTRAKGAKNVVWGNRLELTSRTGITNILSTLIEEQAERIYYPTYLQPIIYGIFIYSPLNEILFHAGNKIYKVNGEEQAILGGAGTFTEMYSEVAETPSTSFMFEGKLYIIGCGKYLVYDGVTVEPVENKAFIPTTVIGRAPSGGGTPLEAVNLLSKWRKNSFYAKHNPVLKTDTFSGDGTTKEFELFYRPNNIFVYYDFTNDPWNITVNGEQVVVTEDRVGGTIIFESAPSAGDIISVEYYTESLSSKRQLTSDFTGTGTLTVFSIHSPTISGINFSSEEWIVTVDDVIKEGIEDREIGTFRFYSAPAAGANIKIKYTIEAEYNFDKDYCLDSTGLDNETITAIVNGVEVTENTLTGDGMPYPFNSRYRLFIANGYYPNGERKQFVLDGRLLPFIREDSIYTIDLITYSGEETITTSVPSTDYTFDLITKTITFINPPAIGSHIEVVAHLAVFNVDRQKGIVSFIEGVRTDYEQGIDNVVIKFANTVDGYSDQINKCSIFGIFGGQNDSRIFLSGNPDTPNKDWASGLYDATYFPDRGYTYIGSNNTRIMGYVRQYETQMIIKETSQEDATAYLRTFTIDGNGVAVFSVEQGLTEIGAVSTRGFSYLDSKPLFVSHRGVETVLGTNVDNQNTISNVSEMISGLIFPRDSFGITRSRVDSRSIGFTIGTRFYLITTEPPTISEDGFWSTVFVCDSRMQYSDSFGKAQYEWLVWDNLPQINSVNSISIGGQEYLLLGCRGMIYRLKNTDTRTGSISLNPYTDKIFINDEYEWSGVRLEQFPIESYWKTFDFIFGDLSKKKNIRNLYLMLNPDDMTSIEIKVKIDNEREITIGTVSATNPYIKTLKLMFERVNTVSFTFKKSDSHLSLSGAQIEYQYRNN